MEQYKEGTIFELYKNDDKEYIILKNIKIEGNLYLVVTNVENNDEKVKLDTQGLLVLKVNEENNEIEFVKDKIVIRRIIDMIFED